ncbi:MAG: hypothetical protein JXR83_07900 [Deltaproteobacteria bacterium]|nr:hypothetical protein [Deltaproteobacteria bacterium]
MAVDSILPDAAVRDRAIADAIRDSGADGTSADAGAIDTAAADRGHDAAITDAVVAEAAAADATCQRTPPWWDQAYRYRRRLTISEQASVDLSDYSVCATVAIVSLGNQVLVDFSDVRIVSHASTPAVELHRRVLAEDDDLKVWFKLTDLLPANGSATHYYLYFGNPAAGSAPAHWADSMGMEQHSQVYLAADDFEEHGVGECPDGWSGCGTVFSVSVSAGQHLLRSSCGTSAGAYLLAGSNQWDDISIRARVNAANPARGFPGFLTRVVDENNLVWAGYDCAVSGYNLPEHNLSIWPRISHAYSLLDWLDLPISASAWRDVEVTWTGDQVQAAVDGVVLGPLTVASGVATHGQVGLFGGYPDCDEILYDDVVVRRFVSPEPTVTIGEEEERCR